MTRILNCSGKKLTKRHRTAITPVKNLVKLLEKHDSVTRVDLGPIRKAGGVRTIKISKNECGFSTTVKDTSFIQDMTVVTSDPNTVARSLLKEAQKDGYRYNARDSINDLV